MKTLQIIFICSLYFFMSCSQDDEISNEPISGNPSVIVPRTFVSLGKKLENPYSVANMKKAFSKLSPQTRSGVEDMEIKATHLYVKFTPQSEEEMDALQLDTTLNLYPYPLDYEILGNEEAEDIYLDYTMRDGKPCEYYAAVTVDKQLPKGVAYEILEELFIPDEDSDSENETEVLTRSGNKLSEAFIDALVDESLKLTGNMDTQEVQTKGRSKWRPSGRISYYDEVKNKVLGVEGLKVKAKRWFTTHTGFVDANGYFSCNGRFKRKADYSFDFERDNFHVRDMKISRNNLKGEWYFHMKRENKYGHMTSSPYTYSIIFRAAYHYCYKDIHGLHRPPTQHALRAKIKIDPVNRQIGINGVFSNGFFMGISGKHIEIYNHQNSIDEIYGTTIHELAHSAHWARDRKKFNKHVSTIVIESWARGVQLYLTKEVYPNYGVSYNRGRYTGIVEDLINGANITRNSIYYFANDKQWNKSEKSYLDRVSGYSLKQIENALAGAETWEQWRDNIKGISNNTRHYVDEAFSFWNSGK